MESILEGLFHHNGCTGGLILFEKNIQYFKNEITIKAALSIFVDRKNDNIMWNEDIQSCMLSCLKSTCNKNLIPNILYPWGCTEYNHK